MRYQIKDIKLDVKALYDDLKALGVKALDDIEDTTPLANKWYSDNNYKLIGQELEFYLNHEDLTISSESLSLIARSIYYRYGIKWNNDYKALMAEYNPIENYDRYETSKDTINRENGDTITDSGADVQEGKNKQKTDIAAFDLDTLKQDNEVNAETGLTTNYGKTTTTEGKSTDINDHEAHLHGNIGVTTNQQMIESEIVLREKYRLIDIISNDIRESLTLKIYKLD